jgi:cell wall-associated NlpC family hydrolase
MSAREAVVAEALSWLGTPYHHHGRVKGVGVDCAMLLAEVYERCGLIERVEPGFYPVDWHFHRDEEAFVGWLARVGARQVDAPQLGDVAVFKYGRAYSHGGIVVPGGCAHAFMRAGRVMTTRLDEEPLLGRPTQFWSLL